MDAQLTSGAGTFALTFKTAGKQTITAIDTRASLIATYAHVTVSAGVAAPGTERAPVAHGTPEATDYVSTVLSTNPVAYFRLEAANDTSLVGGFTSTFEGGATLESSGESSGAPICEPGNHSVFARRVHRLGQHNRCRNHRYNGKEPGRVGEPGAVAVQCARCRRHFFRWRI